MGVSELAACRNGDVPKMVAREGGGQTEGDDAEASKRKEGGGLHNAGSGAVEVTGSVALVVGVAKGDAAEVRSGVEPESRLTASP